VWFFARSTGIPLTTVSGRDTTGRALDAGQRFKIDEVFEHYATHSEYYKRANVAQRLVMEDSFYQLSMELLEQDYWAVRSHAVILRIVSCQFS
jgi:hypothetical protein